MDDSNEIDGLTIDKLNDHYNKKWKHLWVKLKSLTLARSKSFQQKYPKDNNLKEFGNKLHKEIDQFMKN